MFPKPRRKLHRIRQFWRYQFGEKTWRPGLGNDSFLLSFFPRITTEEPDDELLLPHRKH